MECGIMYLYEDEIPETTPFLLIFCGTNTTFKEHSLYSNYSRHFFQIRDEPQQFSFIFEVQNDIDLAFWSRKFQSAHVWNANRLQEICDRYDPVTKIGKGAFGVVYEATDVLSPHHYAVKSLKTVGVSKNRLKNLLREVRVLGNLNHPNVVSLTNSFTLDSAICLVMDLKTHDLFKIITTSEYDKLTYNDFLRISFQLISSLSFCHESNIIHRDIKPSNILIDTRGNSFLSDFGLARAVPLEVRRKRQLKKLAIDVSKLQINSSNPSSGPSPNAIDATTITPRTATALMSRSDLELLLTPRRTDEVNAQQIQAQAQALAPAGVIVPQIISFSTNSTSPLNTIQSQNHRNQSGLNIVSSTSSGRTLTIDSASLDGLLGPSDILPTPAMTDYVDTRWYRAPEVILSQGFYCLEQDVWAVGCTIGEMLARRPLFPGSSFVNQIERIISVLGKPTESQMNFKVLEPARQFIDKIKDVPGVGFRKYVFPATRPHSTHIYAVNILNDHQQLLFLDLLNKLMTFSPFSRIPCQDALLHPLFNIDINVPFFEHMCQPEHRSFYYCPQYQQRQQQQSRRLGVLDVPNPKNSNHSSSSSSSSSQGVVRSFVSLDERAMIDAHSVANPTPINIPNPLLLHHQGQPLPLPRNIDMAPVQIIRKGESSFHPLPNNPSTSTATTSSSSHLSQSSSVPTLSLFNKSREESSLMKYESSSSTDGRLPAIPSASPVPSRVSVSLDERPSSSSSSSSLQRVDNRHSVLESMNLNGQHSVGSSVLPTLVNDSMAITSSSNNHDDTQYKHSNDQPKTMKKKSKQTKRLDKSVLGGGGGGGGGFSRRREIMDDEDFMKRGPAAVAIASSSSTSSSIPSSSSSRSSSVSPTLHSRKGHQHPRKSSSKRPSNPSHISQEGDSSDGGYSSDDSKGPDTLGFSTYTYDPSVDLHSRPQPPPPPLYLYPLFPALEGRQPRSIRSNDTSTSSSSHQLTPVPPHSFSIEYVDSVNASLLPPSTSSSPSSSPSPSHVPSLPVFPLPVPISMEDIDLSVGDGNRLSTALQNEILKVAEKKHRGALYLKTCALLSASSSSSLSSSSLMSISTPNRQLREEEEEEEEEDEEEEDEEEEGDDNEGRGFEEVNESDIIRDMMNEDRGYGENENEDGEGEGDDGDEEDREGRIEGMEMERDFRMRLEEDEMRGGRGGSTHHGRKLSSSSSSQFNTPSSISSISSLPSSFEFDSSSSRPSTSSSHPSIPKLSLPSGDQPHLTHSHPHPSHSHPSHPGPHHHHHPNHSQHHTNHPHSHPHHNNHHHNIHVPSSSRPSTSTSTSSASSSTSRSLPPLSHPPPHPTLPSSSSNTQTLLSSTKSLFTGGGGGGFGFGMNTNK